MLFDEQYYLHINQARWTVAERIVPQLRDAGLELKTCLDVGCGPGWFSEKLAAQGFQVEGLEGRSATVEEARRRAPQVRFHLANIESETVPAVLGTYDFVFCFGLLYHTENPFRVIRNLRQLTKKILFIESIIIPGDAPFLWFVSEGLNETQGLTFSSLIPTRTSLVKMLHCAEFPYVYEYLGPVEHEDFQETDKQHRRRRIFVASTTTVLTIDQLEAISPAATPKYDFTKR